MISRWMARVLLVLLVNTIPFAFIMEAKRNRLPEVESLIEQQEYEKAIIQLNKINGISHVVNAKTDYYYSVCYNRLGMHKAASKYADYFLADRDDENGLYEKAIAEYGMYNYDVALYLFKQLEAVYKEDSEFMYYYGNTHYYMGSSEAAILWLEQATEGDADRETVNYLLYDCYYETENYERGIWQTDKDLGALDSEDEYYTYDRGELLYYQGDYCYLAQQYEEAVKAYQILLDEDSYYMDEVYYLIARCYARLGNYESTYEYLNIGMQYDSYYYDYYQSDEAFLEFFESRYYQDKKELFEFGRESGSEAVGSQEF